MSRPTKQPERWYHKPWFGISKSYVTFSIVFGLGITVGSFSTNIKRDLEETKLRQEFQDKIQQAKDDARKKEIELYKETNEKLERTLNKIYLGNDKRKN